MDIEIAQSTPTAAAVGRLIEQHHDRGPVVASEFLRRSFNQVYRIEFASGEWAVARLCAQRPRGEPNLAFEAHALAHWFQQGCAVSRCLPAREGQVAIDVALPEGMRQLMLFEYMEGEFTGDDVARVAVFASGLAGLPDAGASYQGPPSRYTLDLDYLLHRPLQRLLQAPTLTTEMRPQFEALARRLDDDIRAMGTLSQVLCHGDAHGENNFIAPDAQGVPQAAFFDFDEAGPGYLAYELAVYPWVMYPRVPDGVPSDKVLARWAAFIGAYREARPVPEADLAAIARFMAVRQFWLLGEYAGRIPVWGSQAMPTDFLRRQVRTLTQWETLALPM